MIFRKSKSKTETSQFPGEPHTLNGQTAAYAVETVASESVIVRDVPELAEVTGSAQQLASRENDAIHDQPITTRQMAHLRPLLGQLAGFAQVGVRTAGMTDNLGATHEALSAAAGKRLTYVINLTCKALQRQAEALHGGHDDYYRIADTGCFQFFAKNAQETADLTLIAHRVAELALTPGVCAQDYYRTSHSVQPVRLPEPGLAAAYLGKPEDMIAAPTPSQSFLFGETRRRIPLLLDSDRPAGVGGIQDHESYFKAVAAQRPFFSSHLDELIDRAMSEFAELTGRVYNKADGYRVDDADVVVVAQGALVEELEPVVDYLRKHEKIKAGVIALRMFRPFPGAEITRLLKGKKTVTVLERTDQPLAEDLPIAKEIRSAISKALENGVPQDGDLPFPGYERYAHAADTPRIFSGIYGVGGELPSFGDLTSVFRNMHPKGSGKRLFYVGGFFDPPDRRFPHLQALHQRLSTEYSDLRAITVAAPNDFEPPVQPGYAVELHSLGAQGGIFAGNLFARTLADSLGWTVKTFPQGGLEPNIQPVSFAILHADQDHGQKDVSPLMGQARPELLDMVLVSGDRLVEELPSKTGIKTGGTLIVETNRSPRDLWLSLSNRVVRWIEKRNLQVFMIDSRAIASETASRPSFVDQLTIWTLFGAYLKIGERITDDDLSLFFEQFEKRLGQQLGPNNYLIKDITSCITAGTQRTVEINQQAFAGDRKQTVVEPEPPWTIQNVSQHDRTVFDVNRFWHSVGYLYHSGEAKETLTDPYLATGIMPAGSSAFRDMAPYRLRVPNWLPSNCEACGLCWSVCPDSALPPSVNSIPTLLKTAMGQAEKNGVPMVQMQRASDHLAKQVYKLVQKDDANKYTTFGPLFQDAFKQLVKKMGLTGDKLAPMQTEFDEIHRIVKNHPFSRTDQFFNNPHAETKGSGSLLSIAQNPLSCSGCGLCVEVCPNGAYEWSDQTPELLDTKREAWSFQMNLPGPADEEIAPHITPEEPRTNVYRMLDNTAYHSMVGGDAAFPGNSVKTAVHLVTATIETVMRPRYQAHIEKLDTLIDQIEQRVQGKVTGTVKINDFEQFGQRLGRVGKEGLTAESLAKILDDGGARDLDPSQLAKLTEIHSRLKEQRRLYVEGNTGTGRARMAVTVDPGGAAFWSGTYPYNPHQHPWISHLPGDGPALAEGVLDGITRTLVDEFKLCRQAELEAAGSYDPIEHDTFFQNFDAGDLNDEELDLIPPVLIISQSGMTSTREIGRMLRSRLPIRMVVINTQALPVPAISDGGAATPARQTANGLGYLLLAQRDAFVLQSTVGHPGHLIQGVYEGLSQRRPAVFHIYAPDPQTNGIAPEKVTEQAAMAYESRAFPLFKLNPENGAAGLALDANPAPGADWSRFTIDVKEPSGVESSLDVPLTVAHWAFREARFQGHFRVVLKGELNDQMKPIQEYVALDPAEREGIEPFVDITDENDRHFLAIVSPELTAAVEGQLLFWNYLRGLSTALSRESQVESAQEVPAAAPVETQEAPPPIVAPSMREQLTESLLTLCGYGKDPEFFNQTLGQFIERENGNATIEKTGDDR